MIIGVNGKAGSGKDTFAGFDTFDSFEKLAFAEVLKKACMILFGLTEEQVYDSVLKEQIVLDDNGKPEWYIDGVPASPRLILQWLGTDILRNHVTKDFFIKRMEQRIFKIKKQDASKHIIITDARFPNEAEFLKKLGGHVVKIIRPSQESAEKSEQQQHKQLETVKEELESEEESEEFEEEKSLRAELELYRAKCIELEQKLAKLEKVPEKDPKVHASEQGIPDHLVDFVVYNDVEGDLTSFREHSEHVYDSIKSGV
jgi:hypothetical protein